MWEIIKRFWTRKILHKVYDLDDIEDMEWSEMNRSEKDLIMENLYIRVTELESNVEALVHYLSTVPTKCDKCFNFEGQEGVCFKCDDSGITQKGQLIGWPW